MSVTVSALVTSAFQEIKVARDGDVLAPEKAATGLFLLNELFDTWSANDRAIYATSQQSFTLTPNHQPHTIGVTANSPDFAVLVGRPVDITLANLVLPNNVRRPINIRDEAWWMNVRVRSLVSSTPRDLYYSPDWPNGSINLWPVPNIAYDFECSVKTLLASVAWSDTLDLPMGYQGAVRLTLSEMLAASSGQTVSTDLEKRARKARALIFGNNSSIPNLNTRDAGLPGGTGSRFDFRTGFMS